MPSRIQLPADFKLWRVACLGCGAALVALGAWLLLQVSADAGIAAASPAIMGMACFIAASVCIAPQIVGPIARPITSWCDQMFYPTETLREPPEPLLRALRNRLRDRQWEPVTQQLDALESAYGPSPELFHLRTHLVAGQSGDFKIVTSAAATTLSARAFDRYTALLRHDPPPVTVQVGIDA